ncbi:unnamed protein product [Gongylonema pulchrum]|uniref:Uncharacterized protein n=1 Tax=Gongylonema pulchrum TaxID=637853 RepID=A0A183DXB8_9BILA|nr:unnamed protein product [Gongylonema pulchrum]
MDPGAERFDGVARGGRRARGRGRSRRAHPVYFGPFAEYWTPPPAVFDIPPRALPISMFNANMVPLDERDADFEAQFAPYANRAAHRRRGAEYQPPQHTGASATVASSNDTSQPSVPSATLVFFFDKKVFFLIFFLLY